MVRFCVASRSRSAISFTLLLNTILAVSVRSLFSDSRMNLLVSVSVPVGGPCRTRLCLVLISVRLGMCCLIATSGSANSRIALDRSFEFLKVVRTWWCSDLWNLEKSWLLFSLLDASDSILDNFGVKLDVVLRPR